MRELCSAPEYPPFKGKDNSCGRNQLPSTERISGKQTIKLRRKIPAAT
jgi:hypothetical protein